MFESQFAWRGVNRTGLTLTGVSSARSTAEVRNALLAQRIRPVRIQKQWQLKAQPIKRQHITLFTRQLSSLISASVPLLQALEIIGRSQSLPALQRLTHQLKTDIEAGASLYQACLASKQFDDLFCNVIAASDLSGQLDVLLTRLSMHREKADQLRANLRSALMYPCLVLCLALGVVWGLLVFVVPTFDSVFASFGAELPLFTQAVIRMSKVFTDQLWVYVLVACAVWGAMQAYKSSIAFKRLVQKHMCKWPVIGTVIQHAFLANWSHTMSTLLTASVPLNEGLKIVSPMSSVLAYQEAVQNVDRLIMQGQSLSQALQSQGAMFPDLVIQLCWIGEESGTLETMLANVAQHYEAEMSRFVAQLGVLLEPIIMLVLATLVGAVMLALYLPVFQLGQVV